MAVTDDEDVSLSSDHGYESNDSLSAVVATDFEPIERSMPPPPLGGVYNSEHEMQKALNDFSKQHGYSIIKEGTGRDRRGLKNKIYFRCTRGGEAEDTSTGKREAASKRIKCPFKAYGILTEDSKWRFEKIMDETHNHEGLDQGNHTKLRQYFMTEEVRAHIAELHRRGIAPKKILSSVRGKYGNGDPNNPEIGPKDIYNAVAKIREMELGNMTPIQALNVQLHSDSTKWFVRVNKDPMTQEVTHLFWINRASMDILRINGEIMLLDCTYKTNRYKMPLCIGTGTTALNTSFYAGMALLKGEKLEDYQWLIQCYKDLYKHLDIPLPGVWLSDGEPNIPSAIASEISPNAKHILCVWHIENNILSKCKKYFRTKEAWIEFFGERIKGKPRKLGDIHSVLYAPTEQELDLQWQLLQDKYNDKDPAICEYLDNEVMPKRRKWCRAWTNSLMHFDNTATSRSEGQNHGLKDQLGSSTGDLRKIVQNSDELCDRQRGNYQILIGEAKQRTPHNFRKSLYRDLTAFVTPFALREIDDHYKRLLDAQDKNTTLPPCTGVFKRTMGLPCAHVIEERLADATNGGVLKLTDVHPHWRFKKPARHYQEPDEYVNVDENEEDETPTQDPLLLIQNPRVAKSKGRPRGALNRQKSSRKSTKTSTNSTQRDPSAFEYAEAVDLIDDEVQIPSSQPPSIRPPPTFIRPPPTFVRPPTSYPEPSMTRFPSTPYFDPPPSDATPPSPQTSRPSQVYSQWPVSHQAQNDFTFSASAGPKRRGNQVEGGRGGATKRARK